MTCELCGHGRRVPARQWMRRLLHRPIRPARCGELKDMDDGGAPIPCKCRAPFHGSYPP